MNESLFELADRLKAAKERKKELEAEGKALNAEIEDLDRRLSDAMAEQEVDRFSRNGSLFYLTSRLFASPRAGGKDAMIEALKAHGCGDLVTETVNANTLASFCKEQIELSGEAEMLPEWLSAVVSTYEKTGVGVRKS